MTRHFGKKLIVLGTCALIGYSSVALYFSVKRVEYRQQYDACCRAADSYIRYEATRLEQATLLIDAPLIRDSDYRALASSWIPARPAPGSTFKQPMALTNPVTELLKSAGFKPEQPQQWAESKFLSDADKRSLQKLWPYQRQLVGVSARALQEMELEHRRATSFLNHRDASELGVFKTLHTYFYYFHLELTDRGQTST